MPPDTIVKLADFFGVTTDFLLGKSDIRTSDDKTSEDDPLGLAKVGFNMDNYVPPTDTQREQIKGMIEIILKDNKKDDKRKS